MGNGWRVHPELTQGSYTDGGVWMTRTIPSGYQLHIRLDTDHYQTVITELRLEPGDNPDLYGIRGHLETPTGDPQHPTWQRTRLPTARRQAAATLNHHLEHLTEEGYATALGVIARLRGFTPKNTRPPRRHRATNQQLNLAVVAAAYADTVATANTRDIRRGTLERLRQAEMFYGEKTIGPLITKARRAGHLTPTTRGKPGGRLTTKARRILSEVGFQSPWYEERT